MMDFAAIERAICPLDEAAMAEARRRWDSIAKPVGSMGRFEDAVTRIAGVQHSAHVDIGKRALIIMCADNGVLAQGVASTPGDITAVMTDVIGQKRSSACLMAATAHCDVLPVDIGLARRIANPGVLDRHVASGTADMTQGPAMTREQAERAVETGMELAHDCRERGYQLLLTGEMGIGNTTTSSAVAATLLCRDIGEMTGRGAGLSDAGLTRKREAIQKALLINKPDPEDAFDVLMKVGGLDIAGLAGVFLGGAQYGLPVVADGFISTVAALVAARLCPSARQSMLASHVSAEPAARAVLDALSLSPVLHANMRLGEGTGAVALLPLLDMAICVYNGLPTFADIGM